MDQNKKRKADKNGAAGFPSTTFSSSGPALTSDEMRKILEPFSKDQLLDILQAAAVRHTDVLDDVRSLADGDASLRKLFIRGLSSDTTTDTIRSMFSSFGELDEAIVIFDKNTGKSKGYGFITFKHVDSAILALREPSKRIDGRMTVTQFASSGSNSSSDGGSSARKIYVANVPLEIPAERLLGFFEQYGTVEEGPLGFDKSTGKSKGFCFFIYKSEESARAAIAEPTKIIDGHQVLCKLAIDNKRAGGVKSSGDNVSQLQQQVHVPHSIPPPAVPYSVTGNSTGYPPYSVPGVVGNNYGPNSGLAGQMGSTGGGYSGPYSGVSPYGGPGSTEFGGSNNAGNSMFRLPPSSVGTGGYSDGGPYGLPQQQHQPSSLPPRIPPGPGGMYQGMPPYY